MTNFIDTIIRMGTLRQGEAGAKGVEGGGGQGGDPECGREHTDLPHLGSPAPFGISLSEAWKMVHPMKKKP